MYELETVKVKELEDGKFYIRKVPSVGMVLSIYLGCNTYGNAKYYYFYDCISLMGTSEGIYDIQEWDLQLMIDMVFNKQLDTNCFFAYKTSLGQMVYKSPKQYKVENLMNWYQKNRLINSSLVEINENLGLDDSESVNAEDLELYKAYVKSETKILVYIGKDEKNGKYRFAELRVRENVNSFRLGCSGTYYYTRFPKIYQLETAKRSKIINDKEYKYLKSIDIKSFLRYHCPFLNLSI